MDKNYNFNRNRAPDNFGINRESLDRTTELLIQTAQNYEKGLLMRDKSRVDSALTVAEYSLEELKQKSTFELYFIYERMQDELFSARDKGNQILSLFFGEYTRSLRKIATSGNGKCD
jgi:hypothetical protein